MSELNTESASAIEQAGASAKEAILPGLFAFKQGMSMVYSETGAAVPVTVLKVEPWVVSQVKSVDRDGYSSVQIACRRRSAGKSSKALKTKLSRAGIETGGALFMREIRVKSEDGLEIGQSVSIASLAKGDIVKASSRSKGKGFAGVIKRHGFAGGPAAHGSGFHRRPGSIGNRTEPGRTMPGKKLPGHHGDKNVTVRNVQVVEVYPAEGVVLVKGSIPGSKNTLVRLVKQSEGGQ